MPKTKELNIKYDIKIGPGSKKSGIISNALLMLTKEFRNTIGKDIDNTHAVQQFESIFTRTGRFEKFLQLAVNPAENSVNIIPRFPSDIKLSIERSPIDHRGRILISTDLALAALSNTFLKSLRKDFDGFASNNWVESTRRVRLGDVDSTTDINLGFGELYKTGLVKVSFNGGSVNELKDYLQNLGYEIGGFRTEREDEDLQIEQLERPRIGSDPPEIPPLLKTKQNVIIDRINKLESALDEFIKVFGQYPDFDISEMSMAMNSLIDKLNESGLIGKTKE